MINLSGGTCSILLATLPSIVLPTSSAWEGYLLRLWIVGKENQIEGQYKVYIVYTSQSLLQFTDPE